MANPFALWVLVERFRATGQLSDRRSEMVSATIDRLIQSRPRINCHGQRRALCMLAVALEVYSRNELTEQEALRVIRTSMRLSEAEARDLLDELYGSILRRTANGLAFQMRTYGEYLAAEELEREDLRRIRELAFFDPHTPNDSWMNTVSYLVELNPQVRALIIRKFPFWVLQSSPAAFNEAEKATVASGILEEFRQQRQYLRIDPRVRIRHLARFITPAVEEELRRDLTSGDEVLSGNALVLLGVLRRPEGLEAALPIAKDRSRGAAIRQCAMIAVSNAGTVANIPELLGALTADDPIRQNLIDTIGAITDAAHIPPVLDLVLETDAMLSATYYHFRDLRSREALVSVLRFLADRPQELNNNRINGYIEPILATIPDFFDAKIAGLCADILRAVADEHFYADRDGPLRIILAQLREADPHGEVARLFFERQLQSPVPDGNPYFSVRFAAAITTVETAQWLIQAGATGPIQSLAGFVRGPVRELLRPHSGGVIDAQDDNARRYAAEHEAEERGRGDRVRQLQERLLTRTRLQDALKDFVELTEERWPELLEGFRNWLSGEISAVMSTLDIEHHIRWEGETLWTPRVYPLLIRIVNRYELRVVPDEMLVFAAMGMDQQAVVKYCRRFGFTEAARQTLERLLNAPPSVRALEGLVRLVRDSGLTSDALRTTLRSIATDALKTIAVRTDALQILMAQDEENGFFIGLRNDPQAAIKEQAILVLVERQDRGTMIVTGALAQINRPETVRVIRRQLDAAPVGWRHFLQASAIEIEQAARIEQAQRTPFDAVLRKLRGATSADKLMVVCEGPTDVPVFRALLAQVPEVPDVVVDWVGGWGGLVNKDPNIFLLGAKEAIVIMDGDDGRKLDLEPPPLTDLAREQTARLRAVGVELRVLERFGIENYFPREAVEKVLQRDLSAYLPLPANISITKRLSVTENGVDRSFYTKNRNGDVVAHINLDRDLAGTDLRTIIQQIAESARRLIEE